jgi:hypothetical protein
MKLPKVKPLTLKSMIAFHRSQDWIALWEEFYLTIDTTGRHRYRSVAAFAREKGTNVAQKEFLKWYLGPFDPESELNEKFKWTKPLDWENKRATGGWYTDENLKAATKEVRSKMDALSALKEAGSVPLRFLYRLDKLSQKLDQAFLGELFVPGKSEADNLARTRCYFGLIDHLLKMSGEAQQLYAKSLGIDFANLEGFGMLMAASASVQTDNTKATSRLSQAMEEMMAMAMAKEARYGNIMPEELTRKLIDVAAVPVKKEKTQ